MEKGQLIQLANPLWKTVLIRDGKFQVCGFEKTTIAGFEKELAKTGLMRTCESFSLDGISQLIYKKGDTSVKMHYLNEKNKAKKSDLLFRSDIAAGQFVAYMSEKLEFTATSETKTQKWTMVGMGLSVPLTLAITYYLATYGLVTESSASGRRKLKGEAVRQIIDGLGPKGIYAVGSVVALYLGYKFFKTLKNPLQETTITYQKVSKL